MGTRGQKGTWGIAWGIVWVVVFLLGMGMAACSHPTPTPTLVELSPPALTGHLVWEDGCLRVRTKDKSVYVVWPDTYRVRLEGQAVIFDTPRGTLRFTLGQEVWVEADPIFNKRRLESLKKEGAIPPACDPPYWEVREAFRLSGASRPAIVPYARVTGTLEREGECWRIRDNAGHVYTLIVRRPFEPHKDTLYYIDWEHHQGIFLHPGDTLFVEGPVYPRWPDLDGRCPGPYLFMRNGHPVER